MINHKQNNNGLITLLQEMAVTAQSKSTGRGGVARAGRGASLAPVKRHLQYTIAIAVLVLAAAGVVQISAAAASQEQLRESIDKVQMWLVELVMLIKWRARKAPRTTASRCSFCSAFWPPFLVPDGIRSELCEAGATWKNKTWEAQWGLGVT